MSCVSTEISNAHADSDARIEELELHHLFLCCKQENAPHRTVHESIQIPPRMPPVPSTHHDTTRQCLDTVPRSRLKSILVRFAFVRVPDPGVSVKLTTDPLLYPVDRTPDPAHRLDLLSVTRIGCDADSAEAED